MYNLRNKVAGNRVNAILNVSNKTIPVANRNAASSHSKSSTPSGPSSLHYPINISCNPNETSVINVKSNLRSYKNRNKQILENTSVNSNLSSPNSVSSQTKKNAALKVKETKKSLGMKTKALQAKEIVKSVTKCKTSQNNKNTKDTLKKQVKNKNKNELQLETQEVKTRDALSSPKVEEQVPMLVPSTQLPTTSKNLVTCTSTGTITDQAAINELVIKLTMELSEKDMIIQTLNEKILSLEKLLKANSKNQNVAQAMPSVMRADPRTAETYTCFLIGDSHVRGLRDQMLEILPRGCRAEACFQPGAGYGAVAATHLRSPALVNPQPHDPVILICGTNDVACTQWETIQKAITDLSTKFQHCHHFAIVGVPFRFNNKKFNFHINRLNSKIRYLTKSIPNSKYIDPNKFLKSKNYGNDGLHLNKSGKSKFSQKILNFISPKQQVPVPAIDVSDYAPPLYDVPSIGDNLIDLNYFEDSTFTTGPLLPDIPVFVPDHTLIQNMTVVQALPSESILDTPNFPERVNLILNNDEHNRADYYKLTNLSHSFSNAAHSSPIPIPVAHQDPCSSKVMPISTFTGFRPSLNEQDFRETDSTQIT